MHRYVRGKRTAKKEVKLYGSIGWYMIFSGIGQLLVAEMDTYITSGSLYKQFHEMLSIPSSWRAIGTPFIILTFTPPSLYFLCME
jgi:hypothetical protein